MSAHPRACRRSPGGLPRFVSTLAAWVAALGLVTTLPVAWAAPPTGRSARPPASRGPAAPADSGGDDRAGNQLSGDEGGGLAHNTCKRQPKGAKFRITLPKEAELEELVNWMMSISCQKFIYDPKLRAGKVTVLSPEAITVQEAYAAFYAALETMGLTVEPWGDYFKIVETTGSESKTLPVYGPEGRAPDNARYITQLYRTRGNTAEVVDLITKLKSKNGSVQAVGDLVIITDTGANVRRMLRIVRQIDDPDLSTAEKIYFFQLEYADADEVAEMVREIFGEKTQAAARNTRQPQQQRGRRGQAQAGAAGADGQPGYSRVVVDDRSNTLIIVAAAEDYEVIRRLIKQLDVPLAGGGGRIHVYKLKNADPEEVANVLTQLGSGAQQQQQRGGGRGQQQQNAPQGPASADLFSGEIKVTADPATRSLVILASANDYAALRRVIEQLDEERKSIYIEVYLLELSVNKVLSGGAMGHFGADFDTSQGQGLGFVSSAPQGPKSTSLVLQPAILSGIAAGVIGPQIQGSGALLGTSQDIPAFGVIIQALQEDSDVNFVAEPHLYTADNQEAVIEVGRNVPTQGALSFPGGGQGGGLVPVQSIQRQDVTLNVKLTPHVNDERNLTLDIELENNDIESISETLGVTTTKRRLKLDKVRAVDDMPIVLGGLMQEVERESTQQVPGLGSIPVLGWLFKAKRRDKVKVNLLMILVPHILETPDDARRIHERRMKERLEFLERYTAFKRRDLATNINYRKKSGLLAALNKEAERMRAEDEFRRAAELELERHEITGEIGLSPRRFVPEEEDGGAVGEPATATQPVPSTPPRPRPRQQRTQN